MSPSVSTAVASHSTGGLLHTGSTTPRSAPLHASQVNPSLGLERHPDRPPTGQAPSSIPLEEVIFPDGLYRILPIAPSDVGACKHFRSEYYSMDDDAKTLFIEPYQYKYARNAPSDWQIHVCPDGKLYFAHKTMRVITLTNLEKPEDHQRIMTAIEAVYPQLPDSPDVELLVQCTWNSGYPTVGYYFAHWKERVIYWYEKVKHSLVTRDKRLPVSEPHLQLAIHAQFGLHVEMFCTHRALPLSMVKEVVDSFGSGIVDALTSDQSMFSHDADTINWIMKILKKTSKKAVVDPHKSWTVGRSYHMLYTDRYLAFYGESGARCSRNDHAFENTDRSRRPFFFLLISPLMFFMPFFYLKELDATFVDKTVHYHAWIRFIDTLRRDWENTITPATVLLSANVGFLAIQSVDNAGVSGSRTPAQISSYISAILSLSVYVACQILTRRHRHHGRDQADRALKFLARREGRFLGLQAVALAFSLPITLFVWSMICFFAAMVFVFFDGTSLATKATLGIILGLLFTMIVTLLYLEWDNAAPRSGFGIFWTEMKKYVCWPAKQLRTLPRRDSDGDRAAPDTPCDSDDSKNGSSIGIKVESTDTSIDSARSRDGKGSALELVQTTDPTTGRWRPRWWRLRSGDGSPKDSADMTSELATLPMHSVQAQTQSSQRVA